MPAVVALTQPEVAWKTAADSNTLDSLLPRATIYRVGYARSQSDQQALDETGFSRIDTIDYLLFASAANHRTWHYLDGSSPLLDGGRYTDTLPGSMPDSGTAECAVGGSGRVRVRALDGVHLCPVGKDATAGVLPRCPEFSSGAARLAAVVFGEIKR